MKMYSCMSLTSHWSTLTSMHCWYLIDGSTKGHICLLRGSEHAVNKILYVTCSPFAEIQMYVFKFSKYEHTQADSLNILVIVTYDTVLACSCVRYWFSLLQVRYTTFTRDSCFAKGLVSAKSCEAHIPG